MDERIGDALDNVLLLDIERLKSMPAGSKERDEAVKDVTELYKVRLEHVKTDFQQEEAAEKFKMEQAADADKSIKELKDRELKLAELEEQKRDRRWRNGVTIGTGIVSLIWTTAWLVKGFKFEEEGVFKSKTFDKLSRTKPFKNL